MSKRVAVSARGRAGVANNHILDCGRAAIAETLGELSARGIVAVGSGADLVLAHGPHVTQGLLKSRGHAALMGHKWCQAPDEDYSTNSCCRRANSK